MQFQDRKPMPLWSATEFPEKDNSSEDVPTIVPYFPQGWKKEPQTVLVFPGGVSPGRTRRSSLGAGVRPLDQIQIIPCFDCGKKPLPGLLP